MAFCMLGNSESGLNPGDVSQVVVPVDVININHAFFCVCVHCLPPEMQMDKEQYAF